MSNISDIYQEIILQHSRNPHHFHGALADATHEVVADNPLCGDHFRLWLQIDDSDTVRAASFEGHGCAISKASTSLLFDAILGKNIAYFLNLHDHFSALIQGSVLSDEQKKELGKLQAFGTIWHYPTRVKCATLSWHAVKSVLTQS